MPAASKGGTCSWEGLAGAEVGNVGRNESGCLLIANHAKPAIATMSNTAPRMALIGRVGEAGRGARRFLRGGGNSSSYSSSNSRRSSSSSSMYLGMLVMLPFCALHWVAPE